MSVLIKGMEMPKKELILILFPDGKVATEEYEIGAKAKAVEVSPHGRLIDADALERILLQMQSAQTNNLAARGVRKAREVLRYMRTVIPASEEGE